MNFKKLKTIIIDDEPYWQVILRKLVGHTPELVLSGVFTSAEEAYDFLVVHDDIDLIFLDVQLKSDNGIDMLKRLRKNFTVIVISSFKEFAFDSYGISAIDYLVKPIDFEKFEKAIQKALAHIRLKEGINPLHEGLSFNKDYFLYKDNQLIVRVNYSDVLCVVALENYIKIITTTQTHIVLTTLSQFERSVNQHPFMRVHRSYIVNLNAVKVVSRLTIILTDNQEIPVGEIYRDDIQTFFVDGKIIKR